MTARYNPMMGFLIMKKTVVTTVQRTNAGGKPDLLRITAIIALKKTSTVTKKKVLFSSIFLIISPHPD